MRANQSVAYASNIQFVMLIQLITHANRTQHVKKLLKKDAYKFSER